MLKIYHKTIKDATIRSVKSAKAGSWIYAIDPTEEEIAHLVETYQVEEGLIHDALDIHEVPRLEKKDGAIYMFTRTPFLQNTEDPTTPLLIVVGETFVMTIAKNEPTALKKLLKVGDVRRQKTFCTTQKTRFVATILFEINREFNFKLNDIRKLVRRRQIQLERITNKDIMQMVVHENMLNDFLSALQPMHTSLQTLLAGKILTLFDDDRDYVEDLFLANGQLIEACNSKLRTIINIREAYATIMTNNLNRVLRFFAAITIILTIPTIAGSLFGMNVPVPFMRAEYAFHGIVGSTLLTSVIVYFIFVKKRWI